MMSIGEKLIIVGSFIVGLGSWVLFLRWAVKSNLKPKPLPPLSIEEAMYLSNELDRISQDYTGTKTKLQIEEDVRNFERQVFPLSEPTRGIEWSGDLLDVSSYSVDLNDGSGSLFRRLIRAEVRCRLRATGQSITAIDIVVEPPDRSMVRSDVYESKYRDSLLALKKGQAVLLTSQISQGSLRSMIRGRMLLKGWVRSAAGTMEEEVRHG